MWPRHVESPDLLLDVFVSIHQMAKVGPCQKVEQNETITLLLVKKNVHM